MTIRQILFEIKSWSTVNQHKHKSKLYITSKKFVGNIADFIFVTYKQNTHMHRFFHAWKLEDQLYVKSSTRKHLNLNCVIIL